MGAQPGGLAHRVRGRRLFAVPDDRVSEVLQSNYAAIVVPRDAFRRATVLMYGVHVAEAGTFVTKVDNVDNRRVHSYQSNTSSLSVNADTLKRRI